MGPKGLRCCCFSFDPLSEIPGGRHAIGGLGGIHPCTAPMGCLSLTFSCLGELLSEAARLLAFVVTILGTGFILFIVFTNSTSHLIKSRYRLNSWT